MPDLFNYPNDFPPFGKYYISNKESPSFNGVVQVNNDKVIFEYDYDGYNIIEVKTEFMPGTYSNYYEYKFENIVMKNYIVDIKFRYNDDDNYVLVVYKTPEGDLFSVKSKKVNEKPSDFVQPIKPSASISTSSDITSTPSAISAPSTISAPSAIPSTISTPSKMSAPSANHCAPCAPCALSAPTTAPVPTKSFFDKYFIYIWIFIFFIIISFVVAYFLIKNYI